MGTIEDIQCSAIRYVEKINCVVTASKLVVTDYIDGRRYIACMI